MYLLRFVLKSIYTFCDNPKKLRKKTKLFLAPSGESKSTFKCEDFSGGTWHQKFHKFSP